jgi:hypothetical protein
MFTKINYDEIFKNKKIKCDSKIGGLIQLGGAYAV